MAKCIKKISGWGNFPVASSSLIRPERFHQLKIEEGKTIARGLGRSYGDASLNHDHQVILMERLNRFLSFDAQRGLLRAEAGATIEEILQVFVPRGWFMPVTPGTKFATLGGCLAADIHGKNHHVDGSLGRHVKEISLILPDGSQRRCTPDRDPDLFWSTVGGMGLTGLIAEVTLQLIPIESAYMQVTHHPAKNFDQLFALLNDKTLEEKYSVAWIDCLAKGADFGRGILMTAHHASMEELSSKIKDPLRLPSEKTLSLPFHLPGWALNSYSIGTFNQLYYRYQSRKTTPFFTDYNQFFYPLDAILGWNNLYGKRGFLQYQFVIPPKNGAEALRSILQEISASRQASFLAVIKKFGEEENGLLSFPKAGYTLALDIPISNKVFPLLDKLDAMVLHNEGRIYLAKDARMTPQTFRAMYPRFPQWLKVKSQIDPECRLSSDLSRRLQMECSL